jgi:hypothetical protein
MVLLPLKSHLESHHLVLDQVEEELPQLRLSDLPCLILLQHFKYRFILSLETGVDLSINLVAS